ncbi:hypothetical protein P7C70_g6903, partial [Phenoliferia sp. Uapishka_3]
PNHALHPPPLPPSAESPLNFAEDSDEDEVLNFAEDTDDEIPPPALPPPAAPPPDSDNDSVGHFAEDSDDEVVVAVAEVPTLNFAEDEEDEDENLGFAEDADEDEDVLMVDAVAPAPVVPMEESYEEHNWAEESDEEMVIDEGVRVKQEHAGPPATGGGGEEDEQLHFAESSEEEEEQPAQRKARKSGGAPKIVDDDEEEEAEENESAMGIKVERMEDDAASVWSGSTTQRRSNSVSRAQAGENRTASPIVVDPPVFARTQRRSNMKGIAVPQGLSTSAPAPNPTPSTSRLVAHLNESNSRPLQQTKTAPPPAADSSEDEDTPLMKKLPPKGSKGKGVPNVGPAARSRPRAVVRDSDDEEERGEELVRTKRRKTNSASVEPTRPPVGRPAIATVVAGTGKLSLSGYKIPKHSSGLPTAPAILQPQSLLSNTPPVFNTGSKAAPLPAPIPFDHNIGKPKTLSTDGFVKLIPYNLERDLRNLNIGVSWSKGNLSDTLTEIRRMWKINDVMDSPHYSLRTKGKECYILAPKKDLKLGELAKNLVGNGGELKQPKPKEIAADCIAVQMLIENGGGKQASEMRESVGVVYVHESEMASLGKVGGEMEKWREGKMVRRTFYTFGGKNPVVFKEFWMTQAAVTISPDAFLASPHKARNFFEKASMSRKRWHNQRDIFPFSFPALIIKSGPLYKPPVDTAASSGFLCLDPTSKAINVFHLLLQTGLVNLVTPIPSGKSSDQHHFPHHRDTFPYKDSSLRELEELDLTPKMKDVSVPNLVQRLVYWRAKYIQMRRWIIIVTEEEREKTQRVPGIELMTLEEATSSLSL